MDILLILILLVAGASLVMNALYIAHELGMFPHTKDRTRPVTRHFAFNSRFAEGIVRTHGFQVMHDLTDVVRKAGHAQVYDVKDPYQALENVMSRYEEAPTMSRYDDLVHLSNHISNHVRSDEKINSLIDRIAALTLSKPPQG